ncbi:MAG TPA: YtxH domain-containing protein [Candidatus Aminicenantes bacterium]|nr:YtxH domain-containing protein [Candidatus Aminicenantes bacterium]
MSEEKTGLKVVVSFLSGAAIGAGLALLFAPKSGKETRQQIKELADRVGDGVKDNYDKISGKAKSFIDGVRKKGERDE